MKNVFLKLALVLSIFCAAPLAVQAAAPSVADINAAIAEIIPAPVGKNDAKIEVTLTELKVANDTVANLSGRLVLEIPSVVTSHVEMDFRHPKVGHNQAFKGMSDDTAVIIRVVSQAEISQTEPITDEAWNQMQVMLALTKAQLSAQNPDQTIILGAEIAQRDAEGNIEAFTLRFSDGQMGEWNALVSTQGTRAEGIVTWKLDPNHPIFSQGDREFLAFLQQLADRDPVTLAAGKAMFAAFGAYANAIPDMVAAALQG